MSIQSNTVVSSFLPPMCIERIVLEAETETLLAKENAYHWQPLVIQGGDLKDRLTWTFTAGLSAKYREGFRVAIHVAIEGFQNMGCMITITRGRGLESSADNQRKHIFGAATYLRFDEDFSSVERRVGNSKTRGPQSQQRTTSITIDITVLVGDISTPEEATYFLENPLLLKDHLESLAKPGDFGMDLFLNPVFSDVKIKCEDRTFSAHKSVLAVKSPVFTKMFEASMKEAQSNEVIIEDMQAPTIEAMIKFLYVGKLAIGDASELSGLLYCAEKYDVQSLKVACLRRMKSLLSEDSAGEFNVAVQKCAIDEESKLYFKTFCKQRLSSLVEKESFKKAFVENPELFV